MAPVVRKPTPPLATDKNKQYMEAELTIAHMVYLVSISNSLWV